MSSAGAASGAIVLLLAATVVHGLRDWGVSCTTSQECVVKGSDVNIRCTYTYPWSMNGYKLAVKERFWFINEKNGVYVNLTKESNYLNRVTYNCNYYVYEEACMLTIKDVKGTDSAEYKFRFTTNVEGGRYTGQPGVTLRVIDLRVQERAAVIGGHDSVWLECQSSCNVQHGFTYSWYNNGHEVMQQTSKYYLTSLHQRSSIYCCVNINNCSPVLSPTLDWRVLPSTNICAFRQSTVIIQCSYSPTNAHDARISCFTTLEGGNPVHVKADSDFRDRVTYSCEENSCTLLISHLRDSDSADYKFRFTSDQDNQKYSAGVTLSVTDPQLQVNVRKHSGGINLECHSGCQLPDGVSYIWYKNGEKCKEEDKYFFVNTSPAVERYKCAVKGHDQFSSPEVYAPKSLNVSMSPPGEIVVGRLVNLTCSSDANPAAKYTWYKKKSQDQLVSEKPYLVINSAQSSDSEQYFCTAENDLGRSTNSTSIDVKYSPEPPSVSVSPSGEIVEGSSVTLTCESDANPAAYYTWYKENHPHRGGGVYTFSSISSADRGSFFCKAENSFGSITSQPLFVDVLYAPKAPILSVSPSGEIMEGSSVTLTCKSDANPKANYTWYKMNQDSPTASEQNFTINNVTSEHSGNYSCKAENRLGRNHQSTIHLTIVAAFPQALKMTVGITIVIFLTIILLSVVLLLRKKRPTIPSLVPSQGHVHEERAVNSDQCQAGHSENQEELQYASVRFMKNRADPIYSNIKPAAACRPTEEEDDDSVEYTTVRVTSSGPRIESQPSEDPNALYSMVKKI